MTVIEAHHAEADLLTSSRPTFVNARTCLLVLNKCKISVKLGF
jgi:hypothetical protein